MAAPLTPLELHGEENLRSGGMLVVPNRLSFEDLLRLEKLLGDRKVIYLIEHGMEYDPLLQSHLEKEDTNAIEFACDEGVGETFKREVHQSVLDEAVLIFVPGLVHVRSGQILALPSRTLKFLTAAGAPLLPLFVDHPVETALSVEDPREIKRLVFSFGRILERESSNLSNFIENLHLAAEAAYSARPILESHLGFELIRGLKKHGSSTRILDGNDGSELRYDKLLAAAAAFSRVVRRATSKKRVGILLPPGKGGLLANLAVIFAGKIPVNLNFTAGESAVESCIRQAGLDRYITAGAFMEKMSSFPWPPEKQLLLLEKRLPKLKPKIALWLLASKMMSAGTIASLLGVPRKGGREEAVLLFTSGSSGDPKGVVLSHRNVLANVNQFGARIDLKSDDSVLGCLPLFHSFGCTVTMWYPVIEGVNLVTYPSPLDAGKLADLVHRHRVSLLLATPTFLRGYLRRAKPEQLAALKLVITGAEKLPAKVAETFEKKFGHPVLEGYGLTETSPVTNVNLPDPDGGDGHPVIPNRRPGSVGLFIPGVAARITDPDSHEVLPLLQPGMIWLRGPNIFEGYLDQPEKTAEVMQGDWFMTGDIGRVDEDGFLHIEGRLSRFSKIGGEMVPHETVENAIVKALDMGDDERKIAVVGVPDEAKGEALVLLSADASLDARELRGKLLDQGIPALWIPKTIVPVEEIPQLASGKLDIKGCETKAKEG